MNLRDAITKIHKIGDDDITKKTLIHEIVDILEEVEE